MILPKRIVELQECEDVQLDSLSHGSVSVVRLDGLAFGAMSCLMRGSSRRGKPDIDGQLHRSILKAVSAVC